MEEIITKKKLNKKPLIICLALAIIFGIIGFMDIKSNATELYTVNLKLHQTVYELDGVTLRQETIITERTLTSSSPIYVYYYEVEEPTTGRQDIVVYPISQSNISGESNGTRTMTDVDGNTWYYNWSLGWSTGNDNFLFSHTWEIEGAEKTYKITNPDMALDFPTYFSNGTLEYIQDVDYDNLLINDDMALIENLMYNIIRNEKPSANDTTGLGVIKDVEYYEYLTWSNTLDLPIQIQDVPIVQIYNGLLHETFKKEYYGEWSDFIVLEGGTSSYTKRTDSSYLFENDIESKDFEQEILNTYVAWDDNTYLRYGYRMRYVDIENGCASAWVYVVPRASGKYYSYVEYSDNSTSSDVEVSGTDNTYNNIDDIENAKQDIDKENEVKKEYEFTYGDVDTSQATNWLYSMVDFIKTTPQMVGVVLAFLPQPILYGMYVTIFLGCIASAIAIIKALI